MQFTILERFTALLASLNKPVKKVNSNEECLIAANVCKGDIEDFAHPVNHSCAEVSFKFVSCKMVLTNAVLFLLFSEVVVN